MALTPEVAFENASTLDYEEYKESVDPIEIKPVYNGKVLAVDPKLMNAALAGISIKHYFGKCIKTQVESEDMSFNDWLDGKYDFDFDFGPAQKSPVISYASKKEDVPSAPGSKGHSRPISPDSDENSNESRSGDENFGKPDCLKPLINYRNSFWDLHRPELCKLTWPSVYMSAAILTNHLHDHLLIHDGAICNNFHEPQDRANMLTEELDRYVRLKQLAAPRKLPPDEKMFNFKLEKLWDCIPAYVKTPLKERPFHIKEKERIVEIADDNDIEKSNRVHRSKGEFCITIGRRKRKKYNSWDCSENASESFVTSFLFSAEN